MERDCKRQRSKNDETKNKLHAYRDITLRVFVNLLVAFVLLSIYKLANPYAFPGIEKRFAIVLLAVGGVTLILYLPYGKLSRLFKRVPTVGVASHLELLFGYFKSLSVGQRFVFCAIVSLIASAAILASGSEADANRAAILAYYFLVLGVANLTIEYVADGENGSENRRPVLRTVASLLVLSALMYSTSELKNAYPHAHLIPLVVAVAVAVYSKLR